MSTHRNVAYAIVRALLADPPEVDRQSLKGHVVFENDRYKPVQGQPYVECLWLPGTQQGTIDGKTIWELGTMRLEANSPLKGGATYLNALVDELMQKYPISSRLTFMDWAVTIVALTRSSATRVEGWRRVFVDVGYHANTVAA